MIVVMHRFMWTTLVPNTGAAAAPNNINKRIMIESCAPFTNCISEIKYTQIDDAHHIDVIIPRYNIIESSDIYLKTLEVYGNTMEMNQP